MRRTTKAYTTKQQPEELEEGVMRFVASTSDVDRHDDTIDQMGWKFSDHMPFLWAHNNYQDPLGVIERTIQERNRLLVDVRFDLEREDAAEKWRQYQQDFLKYVSVGFKGLEWEQNEHGGVHFTEQKLLEVSAVNVPANEAAQALSADDPEALRAHAKKSLEWATRTLERLDGADVTKDGRVLREDIYKRLKGCRDELDAVLEMEDRAPEEDGDDTDESSNDDEKSVSSDNAEDGDGQSDDPVVLRLRTG
jgi:HK97 family phage prohead protease